jgi:hypothetical protein
MHLVSYFWNESSFATAAGAPAVPATFLSLTTTPHHHRRLTPFRATCTDARRPELFQDEN